LEYQKSKMKNQNGGIPARRDDFLNFAFCCLIFDLVGRRWALSGVGISKIKQHY